MNNFPETSEQTYVSVGHVCRSRLGLQCQYGSRYLTGTNGKPRLGDDLRWHGGDVEKLFHQESTSGNYHALQIHRDDVNIWVERVLPLLPSA